jgi:hypothetical protein
VKRASSSDSASNSVGASGVATLECRLREAKERQRLPAGGTRQPAQRDRLAQLCFSTLQPAGNQLDLAQQRGGERLPTSRPRGIGGGAEVARKNRQLIVWLAA